LSHRPEAHLAAGGSGGIEHRDGYSEQHVSGQKLISADEIDGGRSRQQWRGKVEREDVAV
jgi:hypothetical protein